MPTLSIIGNLMEVKGPFGLWSFPLLNFFLETLKARTAALSAKDSRVSLPVVNTRPFQNEEYYKIIRGKDGSIEGINIHRKVEQIGN